MKATVHHLALAEPATDAPVESVISHLRELLALAEEGKVRGLAVVALREDGATAYSYRAGDAEQAWPRLLGGMSMLAREIQDHLLGTSP